jgi:hypothetical protein
MFNYSTQVVNNDPRPMFQVDNSAFCAMGIREISFGNTYPVKMREVRNGQVRQVTGGGWTGWSLYSGWVPAETNGQTAVSMPTIEPVGSAFLESALLSLNTGSYTWVWPTNGNFQGSFINFLSLTGATTTAGA